MLSSVMSRQAFAVASPSADAAALEKRVKLDWLASSALARSRSFLASAFSGCFSRSACAAACASLHFSAAIAPRASLSDCSAVTKLYTGSGRCSMSSVSEDDPALLRVRELRSHPATSARAQARIAPRADIKRHFITVGKKAKSFQRFCCSRVKSEVVAHPDSAVDVRPIVVIRIAPRVDDVHDDGELQEHVELDLREIHQDTERHAHADVHVV